MGVSITAGIETASEAQSTEEHHNNYVDQSEADG